MSSNVSRLVVANMKTGYETDRTPFLINNDAFPILNNAYIWRGRLPRKRGTEQLGRLQRNLTAQALGNTDGAGAFSGNIFTILGINTISSNAMIAFSGLSITVGADVFTAPTTPDGTLSGSTGGTGTINYATGALTLTGAPALTAVTITFGYYPDLPVMGLEDFEIGLVNEPLMISFDTRYSYGFNQGTNIFYDTTFYKLSGVPFTFDAADYQQFYSTNYLGVNTIADSPDKSGCMWVTNGNPGFHFLRVTYTAGTGTTVWNITVTDPAGAPFQTLVIGDILWFNEWAGSTTVNGVSGTVSSIVNAALGQYQVTFLTNQTVAVTLTGIVQMMTNFLPNEDGIRWYDGDPTVSPNFGWVNFAPPLNQYNSVTNPFPFYLVGALIVSPFKNRLIFSGVYMTTTAVNAPIQYFPNRIVYSQVGTPYYAQPLPFPISTQAPDPTAWFQNIAGKGGFLTAPIDQEIVTVAPNYDVLIYGFEKAQMRLVYTLDDSLPFIFQAINLEFGSQNTFSAIVLDTGVLSTSQYGLVQTSETNCQRIDLQIPDQIFNFTSANNNISRVTAVRDYRNEWVYFTYCAEENTLSRYPNKTLLYNYRDNNWATFDENYTHYGTFRRTTDRTWANIGTIYPKWEVWNDAWNFGGDAAFFPDVVGGNQHGFVMIKGKGTDEEDSQFITAVTPATYTITSPNHCLNNGDFIEISDLTGITINDLSGNPLTIFQIHVVNANSFTLIFNVPATMTGAYVGGGTYKRFSRPLIKSKQFPIHWEAGRGSRVGSQRYLFETTDNGELTVQVYSSQNQDTPSNDPTINDYLIFSNVVLTSPEPNLYGGNPAYSLGQDQIWHRQSNSFNGDTIQFGFTLSDEQMFNGDFNTDEIILHAIVLDLYPGAILA